MLEAPTADSDVRPWSAANGAVASFFDADAAGDIDERYLLRIDGEEFWLSSVPGGGPARETADLTFESAAATWFDVRQGRTTLRKAIRDGRIKKSGTRAALDHFAAVFQLP